VPAREHVVIAGRRLEVVRYPGVRYDATLVFLHEGLGSVDLWRDLPREVAERTGYGALVYSRYGNGFSDVLAEARDPRYMHHEALTVLPALLDAYDIATPILVGHSDGASIAIIFAGAYPARVAGLVLEAPHVFVEDVSVRSISEIGREFADRHLRARLAKYHADVDRTFWGWNDIWLHPEFRSWNIEASLVSIAAPILCIQGSDDEYGTLAQIDTIAAQAGGSVDRLILSRCGHSPHRDRPSVVSEAMAGWIASTVDAVGSVRPTENRSETH
jgi:pimeloyl-ACP methyl ester carboxylesterase